MTLFIGSTVFLIDDHQQLLGATPQATLYHTTNRDIWERWLVVDAGWDQVILQDHHGRVLGCRPDGTTYTNDVRGPWERWRIEPAGNGKYFLKSNLFGTQLGASPEGRIYTHANRANWEQWTIESHASPLVGRTLFLTDCHHQQVGVRPDGSLFHTTNELTWEQWTVLDAGGGAVFLASRHGTQLGCRPDGSVYTHANRGTWERWFLHPLLDGSYAIRSAEFGRYFNVSPQGVCGTAPHLQTWERWCLHDRPVELGGQPATASLVGKEFWLTQHARPRQLGSRPDSSVYLVGHHWDWEIWRVDAAGDGSFHLINRQHGQALAANSDGVVSTSTGRGAAERWRIDLIGDGAYRIVSVASGQTLVANAAEQIATTLVPHPGDMRWKFVRRPADADTLYIRDKPIRRADVLRFAPVVYFRTGERNFPASIDWLLQRSTLVRESGEQLAAPPNQERLWEHPTGTRVRFDPSAYPGEGLGAEQAVMYCVPQVPADGSFVDLHFLFVHAYQGAQTGRYSSAVRSFDFAIPHYGEHQGDIEGITVRVDAGFQRVLMVRYEAHGDSLFYAPNQVHYEEGTRPVVLSAYNSHGCYNEADTNIIHDGGRIDLEDLELVVFQDFIDRGHRWGQYRLEFAGLDGAGEPVSNQRWARFAGRLGAYQTNRFDNADPIPPRSLSALEKSDINSLVNVVEFWDKVPDKHKSSDGVSGLGARPIVHTRRPHFTWPPPILCVHRGGRDADLWWCTFGAEPGRATEDVRFSGHQTGGAPAVARLNGTIYCVHCGQSDSDLWWTTFDPASKTWTADQRFTHGNRSSHGPALAEFNGTLYCVHRGSGDVALWWTTFNPGTRTWAEDRRFTRGNSTSAAPALAVYEGVLYCVHRGADDADLWWTRFEPASQTWAEDQRFTRGNKSGSGPGLAVHGDRLYCVHGGNGDRSLWWTVFDRASGTWAEDQRFTRGNEIAGEAALVVVDDVLYCFHRGNKDGQLWFCTFDPRTRTWSEDAQLGRDNRSEYGPALLAHPFR